VQLNGCVSQFVKASGADVSALPQALHRSRVVLTTLTISPVHSALSQRHAYYLRSRRAILVPIATVR